MLSACRMFLVIVETIVVPRCSRLETYCCLIRASCVEMKTLTMAPEMIARMPTNKIISISEKPLCVIRMVFMGRG